jgi:hypothetical protein
MQEGVAFYNEVHLHDFELLMNRQDLPNPHLSSRHAREAAQLIGLSRKSMPG